MPTERLKEMARLLQLHKELHPTRIALRFGVTDEYVRQQWVKWHQHEMPSIIDALRSFYG